MTTTRTAAETVAYFRSFNTHYYGPTTSTIRNEYNGKWYANPHTVTVGRATKDSNGEYYCADAVTASLMFAGIDIRKDCPGFCNCGALYNYMLAAPASGQYGFKSVKLAEAQPGDVTFLYFGGMWGHVLMHRAPSDANNFYTVEGDTSNTQWPGSSTTGGVQTDRTRLLADWLGNTHTFRPTGYAPPPKPKPTPKPTVVRETLAVDGYLGAKTLTEWALVMGTPMNRAELIKAVQTYLNAVGATDEVGRKLTVDGICDLDNSAHSTAKQHTIAAIQRHLHTPNDGVFDSPSVGAKALQSAINKSTTGSKRF
jgi:hypothetical protein